MLNHFKIPVLFVALLASCAGYSDQNSAGKEDAQPALLTFPTLKQVQYNPASGKMTHSDDLVKLDGKQVSIAGFMAPYDRMDDLTIFMLLPSYVGCYFCNPPALNQVLYIEQAGAAEKKKKPQFVNEPILVTGTLRLFHSESKRPAHEAGFLYALDNATLKVLNEKALKRARPVHNPNAHGGAPN